MEKNHRLFLRNLPADISNETLEKLFEDHGRVTNVDIKEKAQSDATRIAFVNLTTTDRRLNICFQNVNGKVLNDQRIRVEVAKESYLDRLKRERDEAVNKMEPSKSFAKVSSDRHIERINIKLPANIKTKASRRIYNFDESREDASTEENRTHESGNVIYDPALDADSEEKPLGKKIKIDDRRIPMESKVEISKVPEKKIIGESEIKRLASVKQKRQAFRAKEQLISNALKAVDSGRNNKIVFSGDIAKIDGAASKRSESLFEDDDEDEQADWSEDKFRHDEKRSAQLAMSMSNLGRDKRFVIDERFLDDASNSIIPEKNNPHEINDETQWQLEILQDVLGKPIKARNEQLETKKQNKMIRYDPTASGHQAHELEITKKLPSKTRKRKLAENPANEPEEQTPIPVSSKVFYSVSDNLADTLKVQEEFSLLKTFGIPTAPDKNKTDEYDASANAAQENWQRNFDAKNPFKYESSDDEEGPADPTMDHLIRNVSAKSQINSHSIETNDSFFFAIDDQRFRDAEEFFNKRPSDTENFNSVRRELKMIVRKKVRNNVNKSTPWRNKKIGRIPKSR